jgi:hypothetical protein
LGLFCLLPLRLKPGLLESLLEQKHALVQSFPDLAGLLLPLPSLWNLGALAQLLLEQLGLAKFMVQLDRQLVQLVD